MELSTIFKSSSSDDEVTLSTNTDNPYLTIVFINEKERKEAEFQLNLLNLEFETLNFPNTEYLTSITMGSSKFVKLTSELNTFSHFIQIIINDNESVTFSYKGNSGIGKIKMRNNTEQSEEETMIIKCEEPVNAFFKLSFIKKFEKGSTLFPTVQINLSNQLHMIIHYNIENYGFLKYYLSPSEDLGL